MYINLGPLRADHQQRHAASLRRQINILLLIIAVAIFGGGGIILKLAANQHPENIPFALAPAPPQSAPVATGPRWNFSTPPGVAGDQSGLTTSLWQGPLPELGVKPGELIRWNSKPPIEAWNVNPPAQDMAWFSWLENDTEGLVYETRQGGTERLIPPYQAFVCTVAGEAFGGLPVNDALALRASEGNANNMGPFRTSQRTVNQKLDDGSKISIIYPIAYGPYQIAMQPALGLDTWNWARPYPEADIQADCDAVLAAANVIAGSDTYATELTEEEYVFRFRGCPAGDSYGCTMWNDHIGQAVETYRLSRKLACTRAFFWGQIPSLQECNP